MERCNKERYVKAQYNQGYQVIIKKKNDLDKFL